MFLKRKNMSGIESNILLTIIIPTYNRAEELQDCLSCIAPQVYAHKESVQIYISDNDSKDNTFEIVDYYQKKYTDCISYYKQKENITASPNFDHAVHSVSTPYIYMLSDDDIVIPCFVTTILSLIEKYPDVEYFYLNRYLSNMDYTGCELFHDELGKKDLIIYNNGADLLKKYWEGPSCISTNLFKREVWANYSTMCLQECVGFQWFSILMQGCVDAKCAFVQHPLFICRIPKEQRYSENWVWYYTYGLGNLFYCLDKKYNEIYSSWIEHQQYNNKRAFILLLITVSSNKKLYRSRRSKMKCHISSPSVRFFYDLLVFVFPKWFSNVVIRQIIRSTKIIDIVLQKF